MLKRIRNHYLMIPLKKILKQLFFPNFYKNLYKTKYDKNVLISYITHPIRNRLVKTHSNYLELFIILDIFKNLKFNIDVADYTYEGRIDYSKYDLVFGFGSPFGRAFWNNKSKKTLKICYMTGSLKLFNQMERNRYLKERKGVTLIPRRNYYWKYLQESISMSEAIILTGNEWTESTIRPYNSKTFKLRLPVFFSDKEKIIKVIQEKDFEKAKKHFLWFGSSGALHKGLDLCLDIFAKNKDLFLHVCGPVEKEKDFFDLYRKELTKMENIKYYGFVNIESDLFNYLIKTCAFTIFPSCSEGTSGSLLTGMGYGLIPVATKESGVDIQSSYGIPLIDYKIDYISKMVANISRLSNEQLRDMAIKTVEFVHENHSAETFRKDLVDALKCLGVE